LTATNHYIFREQSFCNDHFESITSTILKSLDAQVGDSNGKDMSLLKQTIPLHMYYSEGNVRDSLQENLEPSESSIINENTLGKGTTEVREMPECHLNHVHCLLLQDEIKHPQIGSLKQLWENVGVSGIKTAVSTKTLGMPIQTAVSTRRQRYEELVQGKGVEDQASCAVKKQVNEAPSISSTMSGHTQNNTLRSSQVTHVKGLTSYNNFALNVRKDENVLLSNTDREHKASPKRLDMRRFEATFSNETATVSKRQQPLLKPVDSLGLIPTGNKSAVAAKTRLFLQGENSKENEEDGISNKPAQNVNTPGLERRHNKTAPGVVHQNNRMVLGSRNNSFNCHQSLEMSSKSSNIEGGGDGNALMPQSKTSSRDREPRSQDITHDKKRSQNIKDIICFFDAVSKFQRPLRKANTRHLTSQASLVASRVSQYQSSLSR
jgi:hypothetical protein